MQVKPQAGQCLRTYAQRMTRRTAAAAVLVAALIPLAPAHAQSLRYNDPVGDTLGPGLDITAVTVRNRDRSVLAAVSFRRDRRGDLILGLQTRHGDGIGVVNEHRPARKDRSFTLDDDPDRLCRGLRVAWQNTTATLRLPAQCFAKGDYGALRFFVLTEDSPNRISDIDRVPDRVDGQQVMWSRWIPRG